MTAQGHTERFGIRLDKQYFNFGSAHFLIFANGTREELHGHNYRATLEIDGPLDGGHVVADFLVIKPLFKAECDALDHRTLLPTRNPMLSIVKEGQSVCASFGTDQYVIPARDVCLLDIENTSSELLARLLCARLLAACALVLPDLRIRRVLVSVEESPGQSAVYEQTFAP